jgi:hypothetical protein
MSEPRLFTILTIFLKVFSDKSEQAMRRFAKLFGLQDYHDE